MAAPEWKAVNFASQLDTLQNMLNEILFETGKAIKAERKNNAGDIRHVADAINGNTRAQYRTFQTTLSELIEEIQDAKVVCIRDYERIKARQGRASPTDSPRKEAGPHDVQHLDLVASSGAAFPASSLPHLPARAQHGGPPPRAPANAAVPSRNPIAPFPDMDADLAPAIKIESPVMARGGMPVPQAPQGAALAVKLEGKPAPRSAPVAGASNFTKIQFTIATPPAQPQVGPDAHVKPGRAETANMGSGLEPLFLGEASPNPHQGQINDPCHGLS